MPLYIAHYLKPFSTRVLQQSLVIVQLIMCLESNSKIQKQEAPPTWQEVMNQERHQINCKEQKLQGVGG